MSKSEATDSPRKTCFTIMPFTMREEHVKLYSNGNSHWDEVYQGLIVPAVRKAGLECDRDDRDTTSRLITENILMKIENADVILCDLSASNPNVYLELGWALRADQRFVLIKDEITERYFDLNQYYTYEYSHRLQPSEVREGVNKLSEVISDTLKDTERKCSIVRRLSLQHRAIEATKEGDLSVELLGQILSEVRELREVPRRFLTSGGTRRFVLHPYGSGISFWSPQVDESDLDSSIWIKQGGGEIIVLHEDQSFTYSKSTKAGPIEEIGSYTLETGPERRRLIHLTSRLYNATWVLWDDGIIMKGMSDDNYIWVFGRPQK